MEKNYKKQSIIFVYPLFSKKALNYLNSYFNCEYWIHKCTHQFSSILKSEKNKVLMLLACERVNEMKFVWLAINKWVCGWVKRCVRQLIRPALARICLSPATICGAGACGGCAQATVWTCVCGALQPLDFAGDWLLAEKRERVSGGGCSSPCGRVNENGELWM